MEIERREILHLILNEAMKPVHEKLDRIEKRLDKIENQVEAEKK